MLVERKGSVLFDSENKLAVAKTLISDRKIVVCVSDDKMIVIYLCVQYLRVLMVLLVNLEPLEQMANKWVNFVQWLYKSQNLLLYQDAVS